MRRNRQFTLPPPALRRRWRLVALAFALLPLVLAAACARTPASEAATLRRQALESIGGHGAVNDLRFLRFDCVLIEDGRPLFRRSHWVDRGDGLARVETVRGTDAEIALLEPTAGRGQVFAARATEPSGDPAALRAALEEHWTDLTWLLAVAWLADRSVAVDYAGEKLIADRAAPTLRVTIPGAVGPLASYWLHLDPAGGRPLGLTIPGGTSGGGAATYLIDRWQESGGIAFPRSYTLQGANRRIEIERLLLPAEIDANIFAAR